MEVNEYNDIVRFLESKDSKQRIWPRDVVESKDGKDAIGRIDRNVRGS